MLKSLPCLKVQRTVLSLTTAEQDSSRKLGKSEGLRVARGSSGRSAAGREPSRSLVQVPAVNHHQEEHLCVCWLCRTSTYCLPVELSNIDTRVFLLCPSSTNKIVPMKFPSKPSSL